MRTISIGVAGLGTVGAEAVRLLQERKKVFSQKLKADLSVAAVCDRHVAAAARKLRLPREVQRTARYQDLLKNPRLDIIVETMGGLEDPKVLVLGALRSGKHVVTANKRLLAHCWNDIIRTSRDYGTRVRFEGSVAGGIPILHALHESLAANQIRRILGILNGTTNFILTRMARDGSDLKAALTAAQRLGLAEQDPTLDLDGTDAAHKISVLASLLTGQWVPSTSVARTGILAVEPDDIRFAGTTLSRCVRLLGVLDVDWTRKPIGVTGYVAPTLVPATHPLASVLGEYNAVMVESSAAGDLMFYGKGAGASPAASAVVGDIFTLSQEILPGRVGTAPDPLWAEGEKITVRPIQATFSENYLRLRVSDRPGILSKITGLLGRHGISIAQIHQDSAESSKGPAVSVFITTHPALHRNMERAVREIVRLPFVARRHTWLRML